MRKILEICPAYGDWYAVYTAGKTDPDKKNMYCRVACWCLVTETDENPDYTFIDAVDDAYDTSALASESDNFLYFQSGKPVE